MIYVVLTNNMNVDMSYTRAMEELEQQMRLEEQRLERQRRPSRFEVTPAPDILKLKTQSTNELNPNLATDTVFYYYY
jgi:hypothetical protein